VADRDSALRVLTALLHTPVGDSAVLVGSSGLFGFPTDVPALTEDIDIAIPEALVVRHGQAIVDTLHEQGFQHEEGTATFIGPAGASFDLLGHGDPSEGDHVGGTGPLRVMVFEDLSRILGDPASTAVLPAGGRALTPAGFTASKLLTERAHKGIKDKIQALLVLAERPDETFAQEVAHLLRDLSPARLDDVRAGAQHASFLLASDPAFSDAGAEGYTPVARQVEVGLKCLLTILEKLHG
jgi:hypothetical protein